jgi:PAS domain S-box-containing protein
MNSTIERRLVWVFGLAVLVIVAIQILSFVTIRQTLDNDSLVTHTGTVLSEAQALLTGVVDAETGQRGYLITGEESYLAPYNNALGAIDGHLGQLKSLTADNPEQQRRLVTIESDVRLRLDRLAQGIQLRRERGLEAAQQAILSGSGKAAMDAVRRGLADFMGAEQTLLTERTATLQGNIALTIWLSVILALLDLALIALAFVFVRRDVTNRSRAEAARLQTTLASIGDAVVATDTAGRVTFMNTVAQELTGWRQAEALGQPLETVFRIVNETTRATVENPTTKVLRDGTVVGLANHTILIGRDGTEHPIDDSAAPIRDGSGAISGVVLVFRDITERKAAEAERANLLLREQAARAAAEASEQYYRFLAESIPQMVWTARPDGWLDYYNQRWYEYSGQTFEQAQGWGWEPVVHPDDLAQCVARWTESVRSGAPYEFEHRFKRVPDGVYRWHLSRAVPAQDAQGQIIKWFGTSTDIDDQKRAVRSLEVLAEASAVLASSLDYEETVAGLARLVVPDLADWCAVDVLDANGALQRLAVAHVDPAKVEWAHELWRRYPPNKEAPSGSYNVVRTGKTEFLPLITEEMLAAVEDPELLEIIHTIGFTSVITAPLTVRDHTLGVLTLVTAESHRHYSEADVRLAEDLARRAAMAIDNARLYREAQDAVRMRDQFLSIAAHELKTPLTSMLGYTQLVQRRTQREGTLNERDQRALRLVADQAERLNRMVASLLDLSRLETGQLSIERAPVDLRALAQRLVEEVQPTLNHPRLVLEALPAPLMIEGDTLRLEQVLQNLIQNAVKYDPEGRPITVAVERRGALACVAITDQGIGIPEHAQAQLFSRFYRAPNVDPQQISGMGLGLYVVKEIVALHGGTVEVASAEGRGSTFTLCLPVLEGEPVSAASGPAAAPDAAR